MLIKAAVRVILATQCQISDFIPIMNDVKLKRIWIYISIHIE